MVYACMWAGGIWEIFVSSSQFYHEPKTSLKNKVFFQEKTKRAKALTNFLILSFYEEPQPFR